MPIPHTPPGGGEVDGLSTPHGSGLPDPVHLGALVGDSLAHSFEPDFHRGVRAVEGHADEARVREDGEAAQGAAGHALMLLDSEM